MFKKMHHLLAFLAVLSLSCNWTVDAAEQQNCVDTKQGLICGFEESVLGKTVVTHLGVPYARAPVGELRFKPPQPMEMWKGVVDGTKYGKGCLQDYSLAGSMNFDTFLNGWQPKESETSEDCLFMDIRAPKNAENLPVMFNIHGGGFFMGSGSLKIFSSPGLALEGNVVYVTINYRLGTLGFGYFGTEDMPGNVGLLDQQMALKWVHDNIASFGGNPGKITIFGESAGGASVAAHLISPGSRPHFSSAIVQSGTLFSNWAMLSGETAKQNIRSLAKHVGCKEEIASEMITCLRNVPGNKLTVNLNFGKSFDHFASVVSPDPGFFGGDAFEQMSTMSFKDFNIMIGATAREFSLFLPIHTMFTLRFDNVDDWHLDREQYLGFAKQTFGSSADSDTVDLLLAEYDKQPGSDVDRLIRLMSDNSFDCPTLEFTRIITRTNPTNCFMYQFDHVPSKAPVPAGFGSFHSSDVAFTLGAPLTDEGWSEDDKTFSKHIVSLWTDLSRNGSPSPDWPPTTSQKETKMRVLRSAGSHVTTSHADAICRLVRKLQPAYKTHRKDEL